MGILNDLKKLFFGASAVGKTVKDKSHEYIKESQEEISKEAAELRQKAEQSYESRTSGLKQSIIENSDELKEKARRQIKKAGEISEDVGEKVIEKSRVAREKFEETSEKLGEKILKARDEIVDKAREAGDSFSKKMDETMDKAQKWKEEEQNKPQKDFADEDLDADGSLLEGKDDFFQKADKYASGQHDAFSEGKISIDKNKKSAEKKTKDNTPASGFEDRDGDGDEIIDDAIIDEEA